MGVLPDIMVLDEGAGLLEWIDMRSFRAGSAMAAAGEETPRGGNMVDRRRLRSVVPKGYADGHTRAKRDEMASVDGMTPYWPSYRVPGSRGRGGNPPVGVDMQNGEGVDFPMSASG